ncbi:MAG: hypothetical protein QOH31_3748 [Verrucomicrobiota bacterium]
MNSGTTQVSANPKNGAWVIALMLAPVFIVSTELWITRWSGIGASYWDSVGLVVALLAGLLCLWQLSLRVAARVGLSAVYIVLGAAFLFFYSLHFVCALFHDCL